MFGKNSKNKNFNFIILLVLKIIIVELDVTTKPMIMISTIRLHKCSESYFLPIME